MMSIGGIENSFIVKKSKNFNKNERNNTGYKWTEKHKIRSPIELVQGFEVRSNSIYLHNCEVWNVFIKKSANSDTGIEKDIYGNEKIGLKLQIPKNYKKKNICLSLNLHQNFFVFDGYDNTIGDEDTSFFNINI